MSAVFCLSCAEFSWIFSIIPLNATIEWPISSIRPTGTRRVKSWLVAISLIIVCIRLSGRVIWRYSTKPSAVSSTITVPATPAIAVAVVASIPFSARIASSFWRFFSTRSVSTMLSSSSRYCATFANRYAWAISVLPSAFIFTVSSIAAK